MRAPVGFVPVAGLLHDPLARTRARSICRSISYSIARTSDRSEFMFLISTGCRTPSCPPGAPTRWRRRASSPLPSSRRRRRSRAASRAAPRRSACACSARADVGLGSRSRAAARRRGCSRRASGRRRGCGRRRRRAASCRCPLRGARASMPTRAPSTSSQPSIGDRLVVLRGLVVLRHVGIEVVLAGEDRPLGHVQVQRLGDAQRVLDGASRSAPAATRAARGTPGTRWCSARRRTRWGSRRTACSRSRARSAPRARSPSRTSRLGRGHDDLRARACSIARATRNITGSPSAGASTCTPIGNAAPRRRRTAR